MKKPDTVHNVLPTTTKAFLCANCGAVSLHSDGVCKVQGMVTKSDWCGAHSISHAIKCQNSVHNTRFKCKKCDQVAVNPELLCEPERF